MGALASKAAEDEIPGAAREKAITESRKGGLQKVPANVTKTAAQDWGFVEVSREAGDRVN